MITSMYSSPREANPAASLYKNYDEAVLGRGATHMAYFDACDSKCLLRECGRQGNERTAHG